LEKPAEHITEQELTARVAAGDRRAMKAFYDSYSGYLTAVCMRYVAGSEDVKDVLQESFMRIFGSIDRFEWRGPGALKAWAARIVVNESLKHLRERRKSWATVAAEGLMEVTEDDLSEVEEIPTGVVMEMIRTLPEGYRTVLNLYVFEQKSHREIASILGIAENSSASQLHRARATLARMVREREAAKPGTGGRDKGSRG
jgi:RNA polymerase sigma-70 factor (ECF subfamily)